MIDPRVRKELTEQLSQLTAKELGQTLIVAGDVLAQAGAVHTKQPQEVASVWDPKSHEIVIYVKGPMADEFAAFL